MVVAQQTPPNNAILAWISCLCFCWPLGKVTYAALGGHIRSFGRSHTQLWEVTYAALGGHIRSFGRSHTQLWEVTYAALGGHIRSFGRSHTQLWEVTYAALGGHIHSFGNCRSQTVVIYNKGINFKIYIGMYTPSTFTFLRSN